MQLRAPWRGPTPEETEVVLLVAKETKILAVKDAATGKAVPDDKKRPRFQTAMPYGEPFQQTQSGDVRIPGVSGIVRNTFFVRSIEKRLVGTKRLPDGIAVGGVEVWVRDVPEEYGGNEFSCVDFRRDIDTEEMNELTAWSCGKKWVDRAMIEAADEEEAELRAGKRRSQRDPVGVVAEALARQHVVAGPTPEQLAALGLKWDAANGKLVPAGASVGK